MIVAAHQSYLVLAALSVAEQLEQEAVNPSQHSFECFLLIS